jgi:hypothetical protein
MGGSLVSIQSTKLLSAQVRIPHLPEIFKKIRPYVKPKTSNCRMMLHEKKTLETVKRWVVKNEITF